MKPAGADPPFDVPMVGRRAFLTLTAAAVGAGADAMPIGSFAGIPGLTVASGTNRVRTVEGVDYVYDEQVNAAYVAANRYTARIDAGGRGWRLALDQIITPRMFGAVPFVPARSYVGQDVRPTAGIADSGPALNAFFAFAGALANSGVRFDFSGFYGSSIPLLLGPETAAGAGYSARPAITGHMSIVALEEVGGPVLTIRNMDGMTWAGGLTLIAGNSSQVYSTKHRWAVKLEGKASKQILPKIECHGFVYGVTNVGAAGDAHFGEWNHIPMLVGFDIGSHYIPSVPGTGLAATFTGIITSGPDGTVGQTSTLTGVNRNLPTWIDAVGSVSEQHIGLYFSGRIYRVTAFDRAASTITVKPRMPRGTVRGAFVYFFGGAFVEGGADGSLSQIGILSTIRSIGFNSSAIYPTTVVKHTSQFDSTPFIWGRMSADQNFGPQYGGGYLDGPYIEQGTTAFDGVIFGGHGGLRIGQANMIDLSKVATPAPWNGTAAGDIVGEGMKGMLFGDHRYEGRTKSYAMSRAYGGDNFRIAADLSEVASYDPVDELTIFIEDYDPGQDRLFGKRSRILVVRGTGTNHQPTGTIILNATYFGNLINGGATAAYSGLVRPLVLLVTADPATGNFTAVELNKPFATGTAIASPSADVADLKTAVDAIRAALTAAGLTA